MKKLLLIPIILSLSSCALFTKTIEVEVPVERIVIKTITVKVPVVVDIPEPPTFERPHLAIFDIEQKDEAGKVVKSYKASIKTLEGHIIILETALDAYRPVGPMPQ